MEKYVTVSAKIPQKLRAKMRKLRISPSKMFHDAIENALTEEKTKELKKEIDAIRNITKKLSIEEVITDIREDRESQ